MKSSAAKIVALSKAANLKFSCDLGELTLRDYLRRDPTLRAGFSGKRPFGNSGWQYDVYGPLIKAGLLEGTLDADGYVETTDRNKANAFLLEVIDYCLECN